MIHFQQLLQVLPSNIEQMAINCNAFQRARKIKCKRPLNPIAFFNSIQVSSGAAAILQFGSLYVSAAFAAHHLNDDNLVFP